MPYIYGLVSTVRGVLFLYVWCSGYKIENITIAGVVFGEDSATHLVR